MKKILFVLVAMVTMSFASCGNKTSNFGTASNDSDTVKVLVDSNDSAKLDTVKLDTVKVK